MGDKNRRIPVTLKPEHEQAIIMFKDKFPDKAKMPDSKILMVLVKNGARLLEAGHMIPAGTIDNTDTIDNTTRVSNPNDVSKLYDRIEILENRIEQLFSMNSVEPKEPEPDDSFPLSGVLSNG